MASGMKTTQAQAEKLLCDKEISDALKKANALIASAEAERDARQAEVDRLAVEVKFKDAEISQLLGKYDQLRELAGELVKAAERAMRCYTTKMVDEHVAIYERSDTAAQVRAALAKAKALGIGGEG